MFRFKKDLSSRIQSVLYFYINEMKEFDFYFILASQEVLQNESSSGVLCKLRLSKSPISIIICMYLITTCYLIFVGM